MKRYLLAKKECRKQIPKKVKTNMVPVTPITKKSPIDRVVIFTLLGASVALGLILGTILNNN